MYAIFQIIFLKANCLSSTFFVSYKKWVFSERTRINSVDEKNSLGNNSREMTWKESKPLDNPTEHATIFLASPPSFRPELLSLGSSITTWGEQFFVMGEYPRHCKKFGSIPEYQ